MKEIPGYSRYLLTCNGKLLNRITGTELSGSKKKEGYVYFHITSDDGVTRPIARHELVTLAYHGVPKQPGLVVNHIDGVKGNDVSENLEWVTQKQNVEHAGMLGITEKCMPVSVYEIKTGRTLSFPSATECARQLGMTKDAVLHRVRTRGRRVFPDMRLYRDGKIKEPWPEAENLSGEVAEFGMIRAICVLDLNTGVETLYRTMTECSKALNMKLTTIAVRLKRDDQYVDPNGFAMKYMLDGKKWKDLHVLRNELDKHRNGRRVVIEDVTSGDKTTFNTAVECAKALGIKPTLLNYRLKYPNRVFDGKFRFRYLVTQSVVDESQQ